VLWSIVGQGKKLEPKYAGVFEVDITNSSNLVTLRDKTTGKLFRNTVHIDRLKMSYARATNSANFFI